MSRTGFERFLKSDGLAGRLSRYLVVGGLAAIVDLGGFILLSKFGVGILVAATGSFGLAMILNFLVSAAFVFRTAPSLRRFGKFLASQMAGLTVNAVTTVLMSLFVSPILAKVIGIGAAFLVNFTLSNTIVFARTGTDGGPLHRESPGTPR